MLFFLNSLFFAVLGLYCQGGFSSSCGARGLLSSCGVWASHLGGFLYRKVRALGRIATHGSSGCEAQAWLLHDTWDLPGPGIKPVSLALTGGLLTTGPPGKPSNIFCAGKLLLLSSYPRSFCFTCHSHDHCNLGFPTTI